jgi:hypothetical protein
LLAEALLEVAFFDSSVSEVSVASCSSDSLAEALLEVAFFDSSASEVSGVDSAESELVGELPQALVASRSRLRNSKNFKGLMAAGNLVIANFMRSHFWLMGSIDIDDSDRGDNFSLF